MKIVYLGSGQFGIGCLNAIKNSSHSLDLIVTQPAHPAGRGKKLTPTMVAQWAKNNNVPILEAESINAPDIFEKISDVKPDIIIVIAFGQKIGNEIVELPPKGTINVHASLLPKYRGAAPVNWAIINGEKQTGISIITVTEKMDAGDIIAQKSVEINEGQTAGQLHDRLAQISASLLIETLELIEKAKAVYQPQDDSQVIRAPKLKKADGVLDFNESAEKIKNEILGLWPWPGASANYMSRKTNKSERVTIARAEAVKTANPGNLSSGTLDENLNIICVEGALKILEIKPAGSHLMDFSDFVNGRQTAPLDLFTKIEM